MADTGSKHAVIGADNYAAALPAAATVLQEASAHEGRQARSCNGRRRLDVDGDNLQELLGRMRDAVLGHGISSQDLQVVDEANLLRFLRARSMGVEAASKMLAEQLKWRASFVGALGYIPESQVPNQLASNKMFLQGLTKSGMPLLIILARRHLHASSDPLEFKCMISRLVM